MRSIIKGAVILLLVLSLGLHWTLLQTVAWTGMVIAYSQQSSFQEAVAKTFDGNHPCALCKIVKQGRAEEQKHQSQKINTPLKLDFALGSSTAELINTSVYPLIPSPDLRAPSRTQPPPKPHPRFLSSPEMA